MIGYVIELDTTIVSVVPDNDFTWDFVKKYRDKIIVTKIKLFGDDDTDFRIWMEETAEKIRRQRKQIANT